MSHLFLSYWLTESFPLTGYSVPAHSVDELNMSYHVGRHKKDKVYFMESPI